MSRTVLLLALMLGVPALGEEIPDLVQTDPEGNFARGGKSFCAPVAISNSLMTLLGERWKGSQYDLVNRIASEAFMGTHPVNGTGPNSVMRGVRGFLVEQGYENGDIEIRFQGWRSHSAEFSDEVETPDPASFAEALKSGAAWLNVGWYRREPETGDSIRVGGHWVTVVGVELTEETPLLMIHDPARRTGLEPRTQRIRLKRIEGGKLRGDMRGLPRSAAGFYEMGGEMVIKSSADCAIIDGAVLLRLKGPAKSGDR